MRANLSNQAENISKFALQIKYTYSTEQVNVLDVVMNAVLTDKLVSQFKNVNAERQM